MQGPSGSGASSAPRKIRAGIVGIERQLETNALVTQGKISEAFKDINSLIEMAKPMVQLAQKISTSMKDKQGAITDDETVQFRQQLLSLGVKDPVTKAKFGSGSVYFEKLAVEICKILEQEVKNCGGMMSLVEVFCRVNRARGVELTSPEDLMHACASLDHLKLPLHLRVLGDKVKVLQHESFDDDHCVATVLSMFDVHLSLTPEEYARVAGIPCLLAKHSLIVTEDCGRACRDESIEGIRFYPSDLFYQEIE